MEERLDATTEDEASQSAKPAEAPATPAESEAGRGETARSRPAEDRSARHNRGTFNRTSDRRGSRGPYQGRGRGRWGQGRGRNKVCTFCADKQDRIDYKNADFLSRFLTDQGKIKPRRKTGTCAKHQRRLAVAIKRARHLALLPYTTRALRGH